MGNRRTRQDKEPTWPVIPNLPTDLFKGAARDYAEFRVPYPQNLLEDLIERSSAAQSGLLVDLACGTGQLALPLSQHFASVVAIDQEPNMIEVARAVAAEIGNITWVTGRAEDANFLPSSVEMVTIGAAFHRLDRRLVAARAREWLRSGGSLAVVGSNSLWTGKEAWQAAAIEILDDFIAPPPSPGKEVEPAAASVPKMTHREILVEAGYDVSEHEFAVPHIWSLNSFWGYLLSTSKRSAILAAGPTLENALRRRLLGIDSSGMYEETMMFYYLLARRAD
ncbi:MAG: class I SAM-dependent methyltransferase [Nitrospira sp.]|nr:class I SAM-dependent methyltransferase [Nitrospira sp.]